MKGQTLSSFLSSRPSLFEAEETLDEIPKTAVSTDHYLETQRTALTNQALDVKNYKGKLVSRASIYPPSSDDANSDVSGSASESECDNSNQVDCEETEDSNSPETEDEDLETDLELEEAMHIQTELQKLNELEKSLTSDLKLSSRSQLEKAKHVQNQMSIYDSLLDLRMHMQKLMQFANRLPRGAEFERFTRKEDGFDQAVLDSARVEGNGFLDDLIDLRLNLIETATPKISTEIKASLKRPSPEHWSQISTIDSTYAPYQSAIIEKWYQKISQASGGGAIQQKKFKSILISTNTQIDNILKDSERLLKRTRLNRANVKVFDGLEDRAGEDHSKVVVEDELLDLENVDVEIFDDEDFYSILLKEFIESKIDNDNADDPIALSLQARQIAKQQRKKLKKIDTKASKGRKIRYQEQFEKLVNFMQPLDFGQSWHKEMADELFKGLFGVHDVHEEGRKKVKTVEVEEGGDELWKDLPSLSVFKK